MTHSNKSSEFDKFKINKSSKNRYASKNGKNNKANLTHNPDEIM